jgi:hypothetical protein
MTVPFELAATSALDLLRGVRRVVNVHLRLAEPAAG